LNLFHAVQVSKLHGILKLILDSTNDLDV